MVSCFNYIFSLIQYLVDYYFNTLILVPDINLSMGDTILYFGIIETFLFIILHRFGTVGSRSRYGGVSNNISNDNSINTRQTIINNR